MKSATEADGLSTAMRLLLHYAGDIHQPLHATSRVNHEYTQGDRGGNSVALPSVSGAKNLHSVWDSVVYSKANDFDLVDLILNASASVWIAALSVGLNMSISAITLVST
jgi:hypothetical protein